MKHILWPHFRSCIKSAILLQSIQKWKCGSIQRRIHIFISLLLGNPPPRFPSLRASQTVFICISSILSPCLKRYVTLAHFHDDGNRPLTLLGQIDEMRKRFAESLSTDVVQSSRLVDPQFAQLILNEGRVTGWKENLALHARLCYRVPHH